VRTGLLRAFGAHFVWAAHSPVAPHEQKAHEGRGTALVGQEKMTTVTGTRASPICSIAARIAMSTVSTSRAL